MSIMLATLLQGIRELPPDADRSIAALSLDSRTVVPDALFMALAGTSQDGRRFISDAVARGAAAVVTGLSGGMFRIRRAPVMTLRNTGAAHCAP